MKRILSLALCLAMVLTLFGCADREFQLPGTFYYHRAETSYSGSGGVLARETRELAQIRSDLGAMLALYCAGPITDGLENPLPAGASVLSWEVRDEELHLHFDGSLAQLSGIELTVAAGCLAQTFLPLTGVKTLVLSAEGSLLNGETALRVSSSDLTLRDNSMDRMQQEFTVYYAAPDNRYMVGREISIHLRSREELPMQLLELLLTPPNGSGLHSPLPQGTRILSASVEDGLCTVDLSEEFESRRFYTFGGRCMSLLCVVNTLTGLEEIDRVEFTVDGNLLIRYGSLSITEPLVRDERCIGPVRTGLGEQDTTVYLLHGSEGLLVPIPVRLRQSGATTAEELIIRYLLADPGTNAIRSGIPSGTALNSVICTDGVCHADFSEGFLSQPEDLPSAIRVITASLCALEGVEQVKITVNGGIPDDFAGELFGTLSPDDDWFL